MHYDSIFADRAANFSLQFESGRYLSQHNNKNGIPIHW